jgi:hypothetical protein
MVTVLRYQVLIFGVIPDVMCPVPVHCTVKLLLLSLSNKTSKLDELSLEPKYIRKGYLESIDCIDDKKLNV